MLKVYIDFLEEEIEVSCEGRFELPSREYTSAELKRISREVNRALRKSSLESDICED